MNNNKLIFMLIVVTLVASLSGCMHMWKSYEDAVINYEAYQEIYTTTKKINTDLCSMRQLPDNDPMFAQFSKAQRINQQKNQLNRWVEEYNAKSKMINRSLWKSGELPYQLTVEQFNCYNGN